MSEAHEKTKTMENKNTRSLQLIMVFSALVLALALRLIRLGLPPLNDAEASIALQAFALARNHPVRFGGFAAYVGLTGFDFFLLSASNFLARFWGAVIGSLIVIVPFFWAEEIGRWPAVGLSFVLAISPEMVGLSRWIGSPMMAFSSLLLAISFVKIRKPVLGGIMLALALMSGPGFWMGILILALSVLAAKLFLSLEIFKPVLPTDKKKVFWLRYWLGFLGSILVVGTGFFLDPALLSGIFAGLVDFVTGFGASRAIPLIHIPLTLVTYGFPAVILGLWGSLRAFLKKQPFDLFLVFWWLIALAFVLLYPSRTPADLLWVVFPLWVLSLRLLLDVVKIPQEDRLVMLAMSVLVVIIFGFVGLSMRSMVNPGIEQEIQVNILLALVGGVVLLVAIVLLVNYGWSESVALPGLLLGLVIVLAAGMISSTVNTTGLAVDASSFELWLSDEPILKPALMVETVDKIRSWHARMDDFEIAVLGLDSPGLQWALRHYSDVQFVTALQPQDDPAVLLTVSQDPPELVNSYRGQDLIWSEGVAWSTMDLVQYVKWIITKQPGSVERQQILLWVRTDLMPDNQPE